MIGRLLHYSSPRARRLLITELVFIVATAVLQGRPSSCSSHCCRRCCAVIPMPHGRG